VPLGRTPPLYAVTPRRRMPPRHVGDARNPARRAALSRPGCPSLA